MDHPDSPESRLPIEEGQTLTLHADGPAGGYPKLATVDSIVDGTLWFLGSSAPLGRGDRLMVESSVPDHGRFTTSAEIIASNDQTFGLRLSSNWRRLQQRAFVRISAHGLQVRVESTVKRDRSEPKRAAARKPTRADARAGQSDDPARTPIYELLDISAGGLRFLSTIDYQHDEVVVVHFELPGSQCFVLTARVVRTPKMRVTRSGKHNVAVAFVSVDEATRSQLLRWVYREQVRRHRDALRASEDEG